MKLSERERRITETVCCIIDCHESPTWAIQNKDNNKTMKCCDYHFPNLLRSSKLPAIVAEFQKQNIEEEVTSRT